MKAQQLGCVFSGILGVLSAWTFIPGLLHRYYCTQTSWMKLPPVNALGDAHLGSHSSTVSKIAIGIHKAEAKVCLPGFSAGKLLGCECPGDFHCVTETDSGVKAGLFSVCDTCFRSMGSGGLS